MVAILNTSIITYAVHWGIGRHIYYLTDIERITAIKFENISEVRIFPLNSLRLLSADSSLPNGF